MKVICNGGSAGWCQPRVINESHVHTLLEGVNLAPLLKAISGTIMKRLSDATPASFIIKGKV